MNAKRSKLPPKNKPEKALYDAMIHTRVIGAHDNAHPNNRVGARLECVDGTILSESNQTLLAFAQDASQATTVKVGSASPSKHAETALLARAAQEGHPTEGGTLTLTTVPCPNCMNFIAAAGIKKVIIDEQETEWEQRLGQHYRATSLQIAANAGIEISRLSIEDKKREATEILVEIPPPTAQINFEDHVKQYSVTKAELGTLKPIATLKKTFADSIQQDKNPHSYKNGVVRAILPQQDGTYLIVEAEAVQIITYEHKKERLMQQNPLAGLQKQLNEITQEKETTEDASAIQSLSAQAKALEDEIKKHLDKYMTVVLPLDMVRATLSRHGIPVTKGTYFECTGIPSSHELVAFHDIADKAYLNIADKEKLWKPIDKDALEAYAAIGCDLTLPPEKRTVNNLLKKLLKPGSVTHKGEAPHCGCC